MARELPRTLETLSTDYQRDVRPDEYTVVCVDNGSPLPAATDSFEGQNSNFHFLQIDPSQASVSPAKAINAGAAIQPESSHVGVMIDGARMCSPGLIRLAVDALRLGENVVVGTIAFHLGHDVQMESLRYGYNQQVEDELLKTVDWRSDGYQLFNISSFAGSSSGGWFDLPAETNAFFMHRNLWTELGGADEKFSTPGGGLVNHDMWNRACEHPDTEVVLLLGEGTFHQFHGGVATNTLELQWDRYMEEYQAAKGVPYHRVHEPFRHFGSFPEPLRQKFVIPADPALAEYKPSSK